MSISPCLHSSIPPCPCLHVSMSTFRHVSLSTVYVLHVRTHQFKQSPVTFSELTSMYTYMQ
jgi:hypothetical protein